MSDAYGLENWGAPYFKRGDNGAVWVYPEGAAGPSKSLAALVDELVDGGLRPPLMIGFPQIIADRLHKLRQAMEQAMEKFSYGGQYRPVYPIKVNQHEQVARVFQNEASTAGFEAGSKPELLLCQTLLAADELLICNGFKDAEYMRTAFTAQQLGRVPVVVIERFSEVQLALQVAESMEVRPHLGLRARLADHGSGRWSSSAGDLSKFGLTTPELVAAADLLRDHGALDCLKLLHFHVGSQLTNLATTDQAVTEAAQIYAGLVERGARQLKLLDVGGGLAVDYDGQGDDAAPGFLEGYCERIVAGIQHVVEARGLEPPDLITEAGRALTAHHAMLVTEVIDCSRRPSRRHDWQISQQSPPGLQHLAQQVEAPIGGSLEEQLAALDRGRKNLASAFRKGEISLEDQALTERIFWAGVADLKAAAEPQSALAQTLEKLLADCFYCNFSLFQSLPDHWAADQIFPVCPLTRLDEPSSRRARVVDITCDSDGGIMDYVTDDELSGSLPVHDLEPGKAYYLGVFLVGAYQDSIGDLHNLFGDSDRATVRLNSDGSTEIETFSGETIREVILAMGHSSDQLVDDLDAIVSEAVRADRIDQALGEKIKARFRVDLEGYTYLESNDRP